MAKRKKQTQDKAAIAAQLDAMTMRAQQYLGIRPAPSPEDTSTSNTNIPSNSDQQQDEDSSTTATTSIIPPSTTPIDPALPCPHPFHLTPLLIALDVEAYEHPPRPITEIGLATLDTRSLLAIPPGTNAALWHPQIHARHLRISEHAHLINTDFLPGCPTKFEFGESEMVPLANITSTMTRAFKHPYNAPDPSPDEPSAADQNRPIVLVGHDISADIAYLRKLGIDILSRRNIIDTLDTAQLFRAYTKEAQPRSLGHVLNVFDLEAWNLHNAGNDAVYTLHALLAVCVRDAVERSEAEREAERRERMLREEEEKRFWIEDELAGWAGVLEEEGDEDGGVKLGGEEEVVEKLQHFTLEGALLDL